jgi:hypothetical protein
MRKILSVLVAAATLAGAAVATSAPAFAWRGGWGGDLAASPPARSSAVHWPRGPTTRTAITVTMVTGPIRRLVRARVAARLERLCMGSGLRLRCVRS